MEIVNKVTSLKNQQVLQILDDLSGIYGEDALPDTTDEQIQILEEAFKSTGEEIDLHSAIQAGDEPSVAQAGRELLVFCLTDSGMANEPGLLELKSIVQVKVAKPPEQETAAIPLVLAAPALIAGCVAVLYVIGHSSFKVGLDGRKQFQYDAAADTPMDKLLHKTIQTMADLVKLLKKAS